MLQHKVLIASRIKQILNIISSVIKNTGHPDPIEVMDTKSALEAYKNEENKIDVVFIETDLPSEISDENSENNKNNKNNSGLDLLKEIKKTNSAAFVVMVYLEASERNLQDWVTAGASGFMTQPFKAATVIKLLHKFELQTSASKKGLEKF